MLDIIKSYGMSENINTRFQVHRSLCCSRDLWSESTGFLRPISLVRRGGKFEVTDFLQRDCSLCTR